MALYRREVNPTVQKIVIMQTSWLHQNLPWGWSLALVECGNCYKSFKIGWFEIQCLLVYTVHILFENPIKQPVAMPHTTLLQSIYVPRLLKIALLTSLISFDTNQVGWRFLTYLVFTQLSLVNRSFVIVTGQEVSVSPNFISFQSQYNKIDKRYWRKRRKKTKTRTNKPICLYRLKNG